MSSEFARKYEFKLKKIENPIYVRNVDRTFNKKGSIENTVEVNIYYQGHKKRMEINVIRRQKWNVILEILWLVHYNPEINWRTREVKMMRYPEKCGKQWRPKQEKSGWQKHKKEERKPEVGRKQEEREQKKRKRIIEVKKVAGE